MRMNEGADREVVDPSLAAAFLKNNPLPTKLERALDDVPGVDELCGPDPELDSLLDIGRSGGAHLADRLFMKAIALYSEAEQVGPRSAEFLKLYARAARAGEAASRVWAKKGDAGENWAQAREAVALGLRVLGDQNLDDAQSFRLLSRAAEVGEEAVNAFSERHNSENWAQSQNDLAETMILLALNTDDDATALGHLERAIGHCEAALRYRTRQKAPQKWAVTQYYLVDALQKCAYHLDRESARAMLERAAKIHEETFDTLDRKNDSYLWCQAHVLFGRVRKIQGELESGGNSRRLYAQSVTALKTASRCISRENQPVRWGRNHLVIAMIQSKLAEITSKDASTRHHSATVHTCESAMEIFDPEGYPEDWVELQGYLWPAFFHLALSSKGKKSLCHLSRAVEACEETIRVASLRRRWEELGTERVGLATILRKLTELTPNVEEAMSHGRRAMELYEAEMELIDREGDAGDRVQLRQELSLLATIMGSRSTNGDSIVSLIKKAADYCEEGIRLCTPELAGLRLTMERVLVEINRFLADQKDS